MIWPAVAGNVAWAFLTVAIQERAQADRAYFVRLAVLLLVAAYLGLDWMRTQLLSPQLKKYYWIGDAFVATAIATFAIGTQLKVEWIEWSLITVFVSAAVGHVCGCWEVIGAPNYSDRFIFAGLNALGIFPILVNLFGTRLDPYSFHLFLSPLLVVVFWILCRWGGFVR